MLFLVSYSNDNQLTKLTGDARDVYRDVWYFSLRERNAKVIIVMWLCRKKRWKITLKKGFWLVEKASKECNNENFFHFFGFHQCILLSYEDDETMYAIEASMRSMHIRSEINKLITCQIIRKRKPFETVTIKEPVKFTDMDHERSWNDDDDGNNEKHIII